MRVTPILILLLQSLLVLAAANVEDRQLLADAILNPDPNAQLDIVKKFAGNTDPAVIQSLEAWRGGTLYLFENPDGTKIPVLLDSQTDADSKAKAFRLIDGKEVLDASGQPQRFAQLDLEPVDSSAKLGRLIKTILDLTSLSDPNPKIRRDAAIKLGQAQNAEYLPFFQSKLASEAASEVHKALSEAVAITQLVDPDPATRQRAIEFLGRIKSINGLKYLQDLIAKTPQDESPATIKLASQSIQSIEQYIQWGNAVGTGFRGLSLAAVLLVVALGLAITFGLMGVINMAHGEMMALGAYAAFVTQNVFRSWFGGDGFGFDCYFLAALVVAFLAAGTGGLILERGIIRFLYARPLESLLATWGVSLVLQQVFRHVFGAANVQVSSPAWLSGSFVVADILFAYNRLFVIAFAVCIVVGTFLLLTRTSIGLQVRAVMQNRSMAACMGVATDRINMFTFAFGSGLAGMAGACLSQIGNVGPSLGQNYIVDCFMIVVLGGVGNLFGTVFAALGVGMTDQILQPWLGAVLGKITVLGGIILFLQWRPAGLFVARSRTLDS